MGFGVWCFSGVFGVQDNWGASAVKVFELWPEGRGFRVSGEGPRIPEGERNTEASMVRKNPRVILTY